MSLISFVRRAVGAAVTTAGQLRALVIPEIPLWNQFSRIGGGLMPQQVANIVRDADQGKPARLVDLVHEGRQKDGHTQAVLGVRELALASLKWSIDPPEDADENEKSEALLCEKAIRNCDGWYVLLAHLAGEGNLFPTGAWAELQWGFDQFGELAGREVPILANPISCRRFGFRRSDGQIVFVEAGQDPESKGIDLFEEYGPGNFITFQPRVNGDVRPREGLARTLVWNLMYRNWGVRDWALAGEMGWKPWILAKYKKSSTDTKDREFAELAIETLTAAGGAAYPDSVDLSPEWPKSTGSNLQSVHRELCEFFGQEISKAVLGQTLTTEAGSRGARSLGDIHENILHMINEGDARGIAAALNLYLVEPYYAFNHGDTMRRGTLRFHTEDGVDLEVMAKVINLIADKVDIPQWWARDQMGCPDPTDEDDICGTRTEAPEDGGGGDDDGAEDVDEAA